MGRGAKRTLKLLRVDAFGDRGTSRFAGAAAELWEVLVTGRGGGGGGAQPPAVAKPELEPEPERIRRCCQIITRGVWE